MNGRYGMNREASFGALVSLTLANLRAIWRELLAYLAVVAVFAFVAPVSGGGGAPIIGFLFYFAGQYWLYRRLMITRGLQQSQRIHIFAFVGLAVLLFFPIIFGLTLLLVPGLFLVARWIAAPSFIVARGENAFRGAINSWNAVRGHSVKLMAILVLMFVGVSMLGSVTNGLEWVVGSGNAYGEAGPLDVIEMQLIPLLMLGLSVATFELLGPEDTTIEEIFG